MGMGKTATTLSAINELMFDRYEVSKVLVIAPLRVANTVWSDEIEQWEELKHLRYSKIVGTPKQRRAALETDADIYIVNRENLPGWWNSVALTSNGIWWLLMNSPLLSHGSPNASRHL